VYAAPFVTLMSRLPAPYAGVGRTFLAWSVPTGMVLPRPSLAGSEPFGEARPPWVFNFEPSTLQLNALPVPFW